MSKTKSTNYEFKHIVLLIDEARNNALHKVNEELVSLYLKVGKLVSEKVVAGLWGEGTVDELASYIQDNFPGMKGFNRRGLYRMKQFFETYSSPEFVSTVMVQLGTAGVEASAFVTTLLTQIQWTAHLHILSKTKTPEEKLFYLQLAIQEKLSVRELEKQLNVAVYQRTNLSNQAIKKTVHQLPHSFFKKSRSLNLSS